MIHKMIIKVLLAGFLMLALSIGKAAGQDIKEFSEGLQGINSGGIDLADFDNDGDADALISGKNDEDKPVTMIYRNNGSDGFEALSGTGLPQIWLGDAAWGDYNNDGYPDILLAGATKPGSPYAPITRIYRNNGNGTFTQVSGTSFTGVHGASVTWGDYDGNGMLDVLITGKTAQNTVITKVYSNGGGGRFAEIGANTLTGVWLGDADFGDYNNDGQKDVLITGQNAKGRPFAGVFTNLNNQEFNMLTGTNLLGVSYSAASFRDFNRDGYADILLTGKNVGNVPSTKLYVNDKQGGFVDLNVRLTGVMAGSVSWGDIDNNGYPDFLITGRNAGNQAEAKIYRNYGGKKFGVADISLTGVRYSSSAWYTPAGNNGWTLMYGGQSAGGKSITKIHKKVSARTISFRLRNARTNNPIANATVKINNEELTSKSGGKATISLKKGDYSYRVQADGYLSQRGKVAVSDKNISKTLKLKPVKKIVLTLKDKITQEPIKQARINIAGSNLKTNDKGKATLDTLAGDYNCSIEAPGYMQATTTLSMQDNNLNKVIEMEPLHTLQFSLKNAHSKEAVTDAAVHIGKHTVNTNNKGVAELDTLSGTYQYQIKADDFINQKGNIKLGDKDAMKFIKLEPTYTLELKFKNADTGEKLNRLNVKIGDYNYITDKNSILQLDTVAGAYPVKMHIFSYIPVNDTISLKKADFSKTYKVVPTYKAVFVVQDGNKQPLKGATVVVNGKELKTNESGMAVMDARSGEYTYIIKIDGKKYTSQRFKIKDSSVRLKFIAN